MAGPKKINRADYVWCATCEVVVAKKLLKKTGGDLFDAGDGEQLVCPEGHVVETLEEKHGGA